MVALAESVLLAMMMAFFVIAKQLSDLLIQRETILFIYLFMHSVKWEAGF